MTYLEWTLFLILTSGKARVSILNRTDHNRCFLSKRELETAKQELYTYKEELTVLKEKYKELDEECETCAEYLKERDAQCRKLKEAKDLLEVTFLLLNSINTDGSSNVPSYAIYKAETIFYSDKSRKLFTGWIESLFKFELKGFL